MKQTLKVIISLGKSQVYCGRSKLKWDPKDPKICFLLYVKYQNFFDENLAPETITLKVS